MNACIKLNSVSFKYDHSIVLENISLSLHKGEFLGLIGPNGSGKSTLIKLILGMQKPMEGEIELFDHPIKQFKEWPKIGYVSQKANTFNGGFPATVFEVVSTGLYGKMGIFKWLGKYEKEKIMEAIHLVGLSGYEKRNIGKLSGGQQQRVFIARAIVSEPELLILDEPTVGVDGKSESEFYQTLQKLQRELHVSILLVSHDIGAITAHVDLVACLNRKLFFYGKPMEFELNQTQIMSELYGQNIHVLKHNHGGIHYVK
ncbi:metal ABC transporter ATP-binding protein [Caldibacillus lycopersici]|uniref:Metal ABC transporter ATP-binding protein n=1 Tax=Perspicuibacillus lycopersici TaxID=1325689 RepID=A0AAE3IQV2_9BACI|nr:metal ABC transporter ATP-binding protein [Perspicuibacillus lycopersici]MCU9612893.1 metal ABC transporter ATP-binding protein [Perspicuibacillus lycopersici]